MLNTTVNTKRFVKRADFSKNRDNNYNRNKEKCKADRGSALHRERLCCHYGCGRKHEWQISPFLQIPTKELWGLIPCKGLGSKIWFCKQVKINDRR